MKKIIMIAALALSTLNVFAQNVDLRRKIEVTGTAEQEVTPDIIYVSVSLQEYMDGKTKINISDLERQLENAVNDAGIPKEDFTINNVSSWNYTYYKKKPADFLASKQYRIKFHDLNRFNQIMSKIDPKGVQSTGIESYDYSKITELKRDIKIKALLAARDKATYLLSSIGEKVGSVLEIQEIDNGGMVNNNSFMMKNTLMRAANDTPESDIDIKKIKVDFQIHAVFEIGK